MGAGVLRHDDGVTHPTDRRGRFWAWLYNRGQRQIDRRTAAVLRQWTGPLPRLASITDGGYHQTQYYRRVLQRMSDPRHPGQRLKWEWVIDYYCPFAY